MSARLEDFDRERSLSDLLATLDLSRIEQALRVIMEGPVRIVERRGQCVLGSPDGALDARVPLQWDMEPAGQIEAPGEYPERLAAVAYLLQLMLRSTARYHMAASLHLESVHADYEALQRKHAQLMESEARYRNLSEQLEARVAEQVKTIEGAQRQLYQAEKLASVGQLAAGVAHEINNPIGFVKSNLSTARNYVEALNGFAAELARDPACAAQAWTAQNLDYVVSDFAALLQESLDGVNRVSTIVADLKTFSDIDRVGESVADVNEAIRAACNVASGQSQGKAEVVLNLSSLPAIPCRAAQISQVCLNLLLNALQAVQVAAADRDEPGRIDIATEATETHVRIMIADNGCGMSDEVCTRVFDPFFTTRDVGQGTGLGLTVSRDIIRAHGGDIELRSRPGEGTCVVIHLPLGN